jgi:hypothetical protein
MMKNFENVTDRLSQSCILAWRTLCLIMLRLSYGVVWTDLFELFVAEAISVITPIYG